MRPPRFTIANLMILVGASAVLIEIVVHAPRWLLMIVGIVALPRLARLVSRRLAPGIERSGKGLFRVEDMVNCAITLGTFTMLLGMHQFLVQKTDVSIGDRIERSWLFLTTAAVLLLPSVALLFWLRRSAASRARTLPSNGSAENQSSSLCSSSNSRAAS
jgi:hypothetical protein